LILWQADGPRGSQLTVVSQTDERVAPGFLSVGRTDKTGAYRRAVRHSRLVQVLRVAIPVGVLLGTLAAVVAIKLIDPLSRLAKLPINVDGLTVSGTTITMQKPRLAGLTQDKKPYVVTASAASQDVLNPDNLTLRDLHATTEMKDAGAVQLTADSGFFETKADRLTLRRNIVVTSPQYKALLAEAVINVHTNHIVSEQPVEVTTSQGTINANRLEIFDSGDVIRFERGVVMVIVSGSARGAETAEAK